MEAKVPAPTEDTKLQVLYDHYKDSFTYINDYLKSRDRLFFYILIVITLMLFQIFSPKDFGEVTSQFVVKQLELKVPIDMSFIGSIIWFGLFALVIRYFQLVVLLERQYKYLHKLEEHISLNYNNKVFTREGKSYLSDYPLFLNWTWILYTVIFPVLLLLVIYTKIIGERPFLSIPQFFNIIVFVLILLSDNFIATVLTA